MFCSAKVTWFMQNASEAIECLRSHLPGLAWETGTSPKLPPATVSHFSMHFAILTTDSVWVEKRELGGEVGNVPVKLA